MPGNYQGDQRRDSAHCTNYTHTGILADNDIADAEMFIGQEANQNERVVDIRRRENDDSKADEAKS